MSLILPRRFKSQPQVAVEIADEYQDAEILALFDGIEWRDLTGNHALSSTVAPTPVIDEHGRSQRYGDVPGTHIRTGSTIPTFPRFTAFAWTRPGTMGTGYKRILETNYSAHFYLGASSSGNKYNFIVNNSSLTACVGGQQVVGSRDLVGGVYNGTHCILYVNGREAARTTATAPSFAEPLFMGANRGNPNSGEHWVGDIDTVGIFPRAFAAGEMLALYERPDRLLKQPRRRLWSVPSTGVTLTADNANQSNTASSGAITQTHALAGAGSAQGNTASAGSVTQAHVLAGSASAQSNSAASGAVSQGAQFAADPSVQGNTAGVGAVTQAHALSGAAATQANSAGAGEISLGVAHNLAAANAGQANTAASGAITQVHTLVFAPSVQDNVAAASAIVQAHILAVAASMQANLSSTGEILLGDVVISSLVERTATFRPAVERSARFRPSKSVNVRFN